MQVKNSATREKFPLSPKKIIKKTFTGSFVLVMIICILGVLLTSFFVGIPNTFTILSWIPFVFIFICVAVVSLNYLYERWYFAVYYYELTPDYIVIKKGPITPKEITIPYERVQDVYVDQDIFDRMLGLYDVHLSSATISSGMAAHIDGVEKDAADGLREMLLSTVRSKISKNKNGQPQSS